MHASSRLKSLPSLALVLCLCAWAAAAEIVSSIGVIDTKNNSRQENLESLLVSTIGTRVGEEVSLPQLSKDLAALAKLAGVSEVNYKIENQADGTVRVIYVLAIQGRLAEIRVEGNTAYKDSKLLGLAKSKVGDIPDEAQIAADRKKILEKYEQAGYHGTEVRTSLQDLTGGGSVLVFSVTEAPRYKLKGVAFEGNTVVESGELKSAIMTKRQWWRYIFRLGNYYDGSLEEFDIDKIVECYGKYGYLDAQVTSTELLVEDESADPRWVTPLYHITEGGQYRLGKRTFEGNTLFSTEALLEKASLSEGDIYNAETAKADLEAMKGLYAEKGYLDLQFYPDLEKNPASGFVDVTYRITEGSPSTIRSIVISGNGDTADRVIRRELAIFEDDLADQRKIDLTKQRLENLGYFKTVEVTPKATDNPAQRDLSIQLEEKPTGMISIGAGYSTEDSVMGFGELSESNFSATRLLSLQRPRGDGQRARLYVGIGASNSSVSLQHTEPALFDSQFHLTNEFFLTTRYEDEYDERHLGYAVSLGWPVAFELPFLNTTEYWDVSVGLRLEQIRIDHLSREEKHVPGDDVGNFEEGMDYYIKEDAGDSIANRLELALVRDTRNHYIFPDRGNRFAFDAEFVTRALGSYADYAKFHAGFEQFVPVPVNDTLFMRLSVGGYAISGDDVRIFDRYFAGGYGTIRGFKRRDVSPVNRNENSIGGKTMLLGTAELIQPIVNALFLKLFTDWGNVWWDSFDANLDELNGSVGVGVQFKQIPIRLDYGIPVRTHGEHLEGKHGRLHFSIDYTF